jgi:hypothetical protein
MISHALFFGLDMKIDLDAVQSADGDAASRGALIHPTSLKQIVSTRLSKTTLDMDPPPSLNLEVWWVRGCAPVGVLVYDDVNPETGPLPTEIQSALEASSLIDGWLNNANVHLGSRGIESMLGASLPFIAQNALTQDPNLPELFMPSPVGDNDSVESFYVDDLSSMTPHSYSAVIAHIGYRTACSQLWAAIARWVQPPLVGSEGDEWLPEGQTLAQHISNVRVAKRVLRMEYPERLVPSGLNAVSIEPAEELIEQSSEIVRNLVKIAEDRNRGTNEMRRDEADRLEAARERLELQKRREEDAREQQRARVDKKRDDTILSFGVAISTILFVVACFSLVPAIGSLPDTRSTDTPFGPWQAWLAAAVLVAGAAVLGLIVGFLVYLFKKDRTHSIPVIPESMGVPDAEADGAPSTAVHEVAAETTDRVPVLPAGLGRRHVTDGPPAPTVRPVRSQAPSVSPAVRPLRLATRRGVTAVGSWTADRQFVVTQGSARFDELRSIAEPIVQLRQTLISAGVLVAENGLLRLTGPHVFKSAAQAAAVFLARSTVGEKEWLPEEGAEGGSDEPNGRVRSADVLPAVGVVSPAAQPVNDVYELRTRDSHVFAQGFLAEDGKKFTVTHGAARLTPTPSLQPHIIEKRESLIGAGLLERGSNAYSLRQEFEFASSSQAAGVFLGASVSGPQYWQRIDDGVPLGEVQALLEADQDLSSPTPAPPLTESAELDDEYFQVAGPDNVSATGRPDGKRFLVKAQGIARYTEVASTPSYITRKRADLIESGLLQRVPSGYALQRDTLFNSASQAAGVFLGRSANGLAEWERDGEPLGSRAALLET